MTEKSEGKDSNSNNKKFDKKNQLNRRSVIKGLAGVGVLGAFGYLSATGDSTSNKMVDLSKELGLDKASDSGQSTDAQNNEQLRIGLIGFGSRARSLAKALGYLHPDEIRAIKETNAYSDWMQQENLNVSINGYCEVFEERAKHAADILQCVEQPGGGPTIKLPVKRFHSYHCKLIRLQLFQGVFYRS